MADRVYLSTLFTRSVLSYPGVSEFISVTRGNRDKNYQVLLISM